MDVAIGKYGYMIDKLADKNHQFPKVKYGNKVVIIPFKPAAIPGRTQLCVIMKKTAKCIVRNRVRSIFNAL